QPARCAGAPLSRKIKKHVHYQEASVAPHHSPWRGRVLGIAPAGFDGSRPDAIGQDRRRSTVAPVLHRDGSWIGWQHRRWLEQTLLVAGKRRTGFRVHPDLGTSGA